ncbi:tyrosine-type recombinase/integrase [Novosphingobium album (ex Hu et al. 2023)]|uniref:Site-specific integrase n=1 Tax=Novosphingobium album (ex Hu et al. 2023) TaxID=2930093 RepID=A0ABT0B7J2_9SPHN|nr:site-specific integrase [Novosphingobium album (ex Hu et al. 2023)]MCJ2180828.1 site-specific integrase [Novosphingobium album (ex Hu et al. 2023)]
MAKHNASNERVKREYFRFLAEAKGRDTATIDRVAKSLARFEADTRHKDFKRFHREQAVAFKRRLAEANSERSGDRLSKATMQSTLRDLKAFFEWLAREPGFRSHIEYADADYFNLSEKDTAIARARREKAVPTLVQVRHVLSVMPSATLLERRDRALVAFAAITGARVMALASFRLGHVDLEAGHVEQDARTVATKFAKSFRTIFMPVCEGAQEIVAEWVTELCDMHLFGPNDPLFPATAIGLGDDGGFQPQGLARHGWSCSGPIRDVFRKAFERADLPYFNPHSFRDMLVRHAMSLGLTAEELKAWSQNLGHSDLLTTFTSYGTVPLHKQAELIRAAGRKPANDLLDDPDIRALITKIRGSP